MGYIVYKNISKLSGLSVFYIIFNCYPQKCSPKMLWKYEQPNFQLGNVHISRLLVYERYNNSYGMPKKFQIETNKSLKELMITFFLTNYVDKNGKQLPLCETAFFEW